MTLKAASSTGGTITDQEILYFQQENQSPRQMDYSHSFPGVHRHKHPWIHPRDLIQRNTSEVHIIVKPRPLEAV